MYVYMFQSKHVLYLIRDVYLLNCSLCTTVGDLNGGLELQRIMEIVVKNNVNLSNPKIN